MKDLFAAAQVIFVLIFMFLLVIGLCFGLAVGLLIGLNEVAVLFPSLGLPDFATDPTHILLAAIFFAVLFGRSGGFSSGDSESLKEINRSLNMIDYRLGEIRVSVDDNSGIKESVDAIAQDVFEIQRNTERT
ncbi:MAG: hypothetical protein P1U64_12070 [Alcanivoracaceae bacterium]|nr:hypothetical protein [Alcanivoracaceae bacterium]